MTTTPSPWDPIVDAVLAAHAESASLPVEDGARGIRDLANIQALESALLLAGDDVIIDLRKRGVPFARMLYRGGKKAAASARFQAALARRQLRDEAEAPGLPGNVVQPD